jgi:beta-barrel assembly-enhancing protease
MKAAALILSALFVIGTAGPAHAQLGGLGKIKKLGDKAVDAKDKFDAMNMTQAEERELGEQVSLQLRQHFGVHQSEAVTKYVSLVGTALAQKSTRANLDWKFIVLDTDGVNAYAAPGGFIHITRGLLGLMKTESELAGVLGHEITHVSAKHTVRAIQKSKGFSIIGDEVNKGGGLTKLAITKLAGLAYKTIFEGEFSREDENESDEVGVVLANGLGYAPTGMLEVLKKIDARNGGREDRNGLFASHPATQDRIGKITKLIAEKKLTAKATVAARYKETIPFDAKPASEITTNVAGAAGLASGDKKKPEDDKKPAEPAKKGNALDSITGKKQAQSGQQVASAGARGGLPDRDAVGGSNPNAVNVKVTAAELDAFKKGIVA